MSPKQKRLWIIAKSLLAAVLIAAVGWHFTKLLRHQDVWDHLTAARPEYLIPAGLLYVCAHVLWGTFWVQLMWGQGGKVSWFVGVRAYFVSQFGKYVPGKAWVIVLRVGLLRGQGMHPAVIAVTATYETLTSMAAGALIGVILLPWTGERFGGEFGATRWVALGIIGGMPLMVGVMHRLGARFAKKYRAPDARPLAIPTFRLLTQGLIQDSFGWFLLGCSLWLTVRGLTGDAVPLNPGVFCQDLAAATLSYVAGFVILVSPGGLGAREWVLQQILTPQLQPSSGAAAAGVAAVVALVLRLVWTAFEVVVALLLFWFGRNRNPAPGTEPSEPVVIVGGTSTHG